MVGTYDEVGDRTVRGICGQVDGSVLPGYIGFEAGQAAFGDLYAWFRRVMAWPLRQIAGSDPQLEERILGELTAEAELPLTPDDPVALDWHNGRRTPDADPRVRGALDGLTLATSAPAIYKALVEATVFGSRAIDERMLEEGVPIDNILAIGGMSAMARMAQPLPSPRSSGADGADGHEHHRDRRQAGFLAALGILQVLPHADEIAALGMAHREKKTGLKPEENLSLLRVISRQYMLKHTPSVQFPPQSSLL